ncbi:hypothetical protein Clacol_009088 [Clathrus columnatus]|uniref:Uncharacterized protein n=1 Tax=Clathrus columnatus TaxID=1419009 RepID=A0AAV5AKA0_9AGAM|nr:hypothetical protein Clacol_009088 [Clathrus columnatus]
MISLAFALPIIRREVPQEHSHEQFLTTVKTFLDMNNPAGIVDPVFGLLGNAAAAGGQGSITDTDCLQQATADQAFTNAKAAGNVGGMTAALIYRALERNTGQVGLASNPCTSIQAVNPEIAAIQQHQDPASSNAATINKAIALALAQQINSIGGNATEAILSGTFAPGNLNDNTGKGNTCDDANDPVGCIFTQNLLVPDVTPEEIQAAISSNNAVSIPNASDACNADISSSTPASSSASSSSSASPASSSSSSSSSDSSSSSTPVSSSSSADPTSSSSSSSASSSNSSGANLQTFTGSLGGAPPAVVAGGNEFTVEGNNSFQTLSTALQRSCSVQHNTCADAANANKNAGFSVGQCDQQETQCNNVATAASN